VLLGETRPELGGSEYLNRLHGLLRGTPPALDLDAEKRLQHLLVSLAADGVLQSAHDTAEGGIAVTLAECCFDTDGLGATIDLPAVTATADGAGSEWATDFALFSESVTRVVVSAAAEKREALLKQAAASGVPATVIGTTGGTRLTIRAGAIAAIDVSVPDAERVWSTGLERYFVRS
jgi:phosphoribosylformylglycinamidine synthase subunit PurL